MPQLVSQQEIMARLNPALAQSQFFRMQRVANDPNVPEAIRTSAQDAMATHVAAARKAGVSPYLYQSGGEAAEEQGLVKPKPREERAPAAQPASAAPINLDMGIEAAGAPLVTPQGIEGGSADPGPFRSTPAEQRAAAFGGRVDRMNQALAWPFKKLGEMVGDSHYDEARQEVVANSQPSSSFLKPGAEAQEAPADQPGPTASQTFPLAASSVPVPMSKPRPPADAPAPRKAKAAAPAAAPQGIEQTAPMASQQFPISVGIEGSSAGNTAGSGGSGSSGGGDTPPAYKPDATPAPDQPKSMNPLAFALIKGGAALMASNKPFGQALGEGVGAGLEGYVDAQQIGIDRANEQAKQRREDALAGADVYGKTQLDPWRSGAQVQQGNRELDIRSLESDRRNNLGERELDLRKTDSERDYELGKQRVGIEGAGLGLRQQELGIAQGQLDVARQNLTPSDVRTVEALTQRVMDLDRSLSPQQAWQKAIELFGQLNPSPSLGLGSLLGAPQEIPDSAIGGAVR